LRFSRLIKLGPARLVIKGLLTNLFNTEQIINVYPTTGEPDDHGDAEPTLSQFGYLPISSTRYSPQTDFNHDGLISPAEMKESYIAARSDYYMDPENYNDPFKVQLGAGIGF
jgi:hypothetical protein